MGGQMTKLWTSRQLPGTRISLGGAIRAASPVPLEFPTYRGGRAPEPRRDPAYRSTRGNPARDLLTLLQPQRHRRAPTCCWGNASIQSQYAVHAALVPSLERSRNVGYTLTVPPAVPKLGLLLRREPRPCVPLHTHTSSSGKIRRCCVDRLNPPRCSFIPCHGDSDTAMEERLRRAFSRGGAEQVSSLHFGACAPDTDLWFAGEDWWLSSAAA